MRYLVLPQRPAGTESWSEQDLQQLVSRNSMIGVELARSPEQKGEGEQVKGGHDLGGQLEMGPINPEPESQEPVFHAIGSGVFLLSR